jgi:predicted S18 family serine protease
MIVQTGNVLRNELRPVLAPSAVLTNTVGLAAGAAGGSVLYGLSLLGAVAPNSVHAVSGR